MKLFNGKSGNANYQARVKTITSTHGANDRLEIDLTFFDQDTGDICDSFSRIVFFNTTSDPKRAVAFVLRNPERY